MAKRLNPIKKRKYGNIKKVVDGFKFDSLKEANYYGKLKLQRLAKQVTLFELQPRYDLIVNNVNCGFYKADFKVWYSDGSIKVIDCKGVKTSTYALKKRLVKALYGIDIIEV